MAKKSNDDKYSNLETIHGCDIDVERRIIYTHSEFETEEQGVDFRMASKFIKNLDHLNFLSSDPITIKIISFGGCWNYGMAMYDAMITSTSPITTISYAHARSMSSIIPQAATTRLISKNADFMVHYGDYGDYGDYRKVVNGVKHAERQSEVMLDIYAARCIHGKFFDGWKKEDAVSFIRDKIDLKTDWWLTAEEAVHYGFMDKVV